MADPNTERDPLEVLAEEYMDLLRQGKRVSVEDYAAQHPKFAEDIATGHQNCLATAAVPEPE